MNGFGRKSYRYHVGLLFDQKSWLLTYRERAEVYGTDRGIIS